MSKQEVLLIACGALANEVNAVLSANQLTNISVEYLSASLHNRPEKLAPTLRTRVERGLDQGKKVFLGYADCGSGGAIDTLCEEYSIERLPGAHCYEFFLQPGVFREFHAVNPGTFFLTDYLARHFDRLVLEGLGIIEHPELFEIYFGNYSKVLFMSQSGSEHALRDAHSAARKLKLPIEVIAGGYGQFADALLDVSVMHPRIGAGGV